MCLAALMLQREKQVWRTHKRMLHGARAPNFAGKQGQWWGSSSTESRSDQRLTLHPCGQNWVFSPSHAVQAAALSHFSGALNAAGWQEPSPSATGRRGPCLWSLQGPTSPELAAGSSGCLHCCQEPAESSLLLLGFPHTSTLGEAAQPHCRDPLVSQECQTGFRVKKRDYRYKIHPWIIASKRKLWLLCLIFLPELLCYTYLEVQ